MFHFAIFCIRYFIDLLAALGSNRLVLYPPLHVDATLVFIRII